tara:strand:+ start:1070 stop:1306 length:237 start_codon:yes stop_codon:yes gene_type:complete
MCELVHPSVGWNVVEWRGGAGYGSGLPSMAVFKEPACLTHCVGNVVDAPPVRVQMRDIFFCGFGRRGLPRFVIEVADP